MVLVGVSLDTLAWIQLVMAVGLTVDYVIHVTHAIADADPIKDKIVTGTHKYDKSNDDYGERITIAMNDMGIDVAKGAFTTFLGVLTLAFSISQGFRVFFLMFVGIILVSFLHGMLFVPAVLGEMPWIYSRIDKVPDPVKQQLSIDVHLSRGLSLEVDLMNKLWKDTQVQYDIQCQENNLNINLSQIPESVPVTPHGRKQNEY